MSKCMRGEHDHVCVVVREGYTYEIPCSIGI